MNNDDTIGNGTGFFVKKCNHLYLVSNFHVLANKSYNLTQFKDKWNRILIRYGNKDSWHYYSLDLKEKVWPKTNALTKSLPVDLWAVEIPELLSQKIYSINIENNSLKDSSIHIGSKVFIYGFSQSGYRKERNYDKREPELGYGYIEKYESGVIDGSNNEFELTHITAGGFSGAPAFAYSTYDSSFKFLGVIFASGGKTIDQSSLGFRCDLVDYFLPLCK